MPTGSDLLRIAHTRIGDKYILGALAPKNNPAWTGPWDCAEFVSWVVYQAIGRLYGCYRNNGNPASADAYTGYWVRDAKNHLQRIPLAEAYRTPGAILLRAPATGLIGHIAFSDGKGGTIEAHSRDRGVIAGTATDRRWDLGVLLPEVGYTEGSALPETPAPSRRVLRFKSPRMTGADVEAVQRALEREGFNPGPIDGDFGRMTAAAVYNFQLSRGLNPDAEVGPITARSLKISWT